MLVWFVYFRIFLVRIKEYANSVANRKISQLSSQGSEKRLKDVFANNIDYCEQERLFKGNYNKSKQEFVFWNS
jgi:hypothetical protein